MKYHRRSLGFKEKEEWLYKTQWCCQIRGKLQTTAQRNPGVQGWRRMTLPLKRWVMTAGGERGVYDPNSRQWCLFTRIYVCTCTKINTQAGIWSPGKIWFLGRLPRGTSHETLQTPSAAVPGPTSSRANPRYTQHAPGGLCSPPPRKGWTPPLGEVTADCFASYHPPIPPAGCQWSTQANTSKELLVY